MTHTDEPRTVSDVWHCQMRTLNRALLSAGDARAVSDRDVDGLEAAAVVASFSEHGESLRRLAAKLRALLPPAEGAR